MRGLVQRFLEQYLASNAQTPSSWLMCWCTASLLNREKSIFNCSGRLPQIVWRLLCSCSGLKLRPLLGFFVSNAGLERCPRALTVQAQCCVDRRPAQTGLLDDLHHADTCLVHTENLFAAFVQYFSRLLAGIFFLHKPLTTQIIKSPLLNRTSSTAYIALIQVPRPLSSGH